MNKNKLILFAEDSPSQAMHLKIVLEAAGYKSIHCLNGKEAVEQLEKHTPDLVISDVLMPLMNGFELCQYIKSHNKHQTIPVLLLTLLSDINDVIKGITSGADTFISKPFNADHLLSIISNLINGAEEPYEINKLFCDDSLVKSNDSIIRFLFSAYKIAIDKSKALEASQQELKAVNQSLEKSIKDRTTELENEIKEKNKMLIALKEKDSIINEITDNILDFVSKINNQGDIIWVNSTFHKNFGYDLNQLAKLNIQDIIHEDDRKQFVKDLEKAKAKKKPFSGDYKLINAKNEVSWQSCIVNFISKNDSVDGAVISGKDITMRKYLEEEIIIAREKAEKSDNLKSIFLTNMSHDLRTPMNAIIGFAELLKEDGILKTDKQEYLDLISRNGENLLNLINDIIDISKIEAGKIKSKIAKCPLNLLLNELEKNFNQIKTLKGNSDVKIFFDKTNIIDDLIIHTDPFRLKQILSNLIGNAIKFTNEGFIEFSYKLLPNRFLEFYVKDTGIGISKKDLPAIFNRYEQVKPSDSPEVGTGLGLAITNSLVKLLGGKPHVESKENEGSTFYFTIPYNPASGPVIDYFPKKPEKIGSYDFNKKTVLVVEDNLSNYNYLRAVLIKANTKVVWAKDGKEALTQYKKHKDISIVLMDIHLPMLNGFRVTEEILKLNPNTPIIAQTAYAMSGDEEKCYKAGCVDYMAKPIKPDILLAKINKYIN